MVLPSFVPFPYLFLVSESGTAFSAAQLGPGVPAGAVGAESPANPIGEKISHARGHTVCRPVLKNFFALGGGYGLQPLNSEREAERTEKIIPNPSALTDLGRAA